METEKENAIKTDERSNTSTRYGGQQDQHSEKNKDGPKTDQTKQGSDMNTPKPGEQVQCPDKKEYDVQGDTSKNTQHLSDDAKPNGQSPRDNNCNEDVDRERHPEEQIIK